MTAKGRGFLGLPRNVVALGCVSMFTDAATEMIYPLLPRFLTGVLGASATQLGAIEGAAEMAASLLKLVSGWWSDKIRKRKPVVVFGYALATVVRPFVAAATSWTHVLAVRVTDRFGKGLRDAPRDALVTESVEPARRGRAFGWNRAADNAGATAGALTAALLLYLWGDDHIRTIFWLSAIPGALAVITLLVFVSDIPKGAATDGPSLRRPADPRMWRFLAVLFVFTIGNSSDAFLLLRATQLGVSDWALPVIWAVLQASKALSSLPGGTLSDRFGRRPLILAGWAWFALMYAGFAVATDEWHAWALFAGFGCFYGLTQGPERAFVADLSPESGRGTSFGFYNLVIGVGALPASLLFGWVWDTHGPGTAFTMGAVVAAVAGAGLLTLVRSPAGRGSSAAE